MVRFAGDGRHEISVLRLYSTCCRWKILRNLRHVLLEVICVVEAFDHGTELTSRNCAQLLHTVSVVIIYKLCGKNLAEFDQLCVEAIKINQPLYIALAASTKVHERFPPNRELDDCTLFVDRVKGTSRYTICARRRAHDDTVQFLLAILLRNQVHPMVLGG